MDILAEMRPKTSSQTPGDQGLVRQRIPGGSVSKTTEISSCHQSRLLQQLDEQRRQELFCDCSVMVEGKLFKAHRNVLFASSGYFRMLLSHGAQDCGKVVSASFEVFSPETFTVILDFVYSGHLDLTSHNVIEVMSAASYLQMTDVIGYCKTFIKSSLDISAKDDEDRYLSLSENGLQAGSESLLYTSDNVSSVLKNTNSSTSGHLSSSWRAYNSGSSSGTQQDYQQSGGSKELKQENSHSLVPSPTEVLDFKTGNPRPGRPPVDPDSRLRRHSAASAGDAEAESPNSFQYSPSSDGVLGGGKKMNWSGSSGTPEMKGTPSRPKAEKADELYATLPTIVGVVGLFNKDDCPTMRFKCPFCTHTVKRKADLKRHLRCHTGERPYPCEACGKRFTRLEHLRSHFQTIHQARKLICRKCKRQVTELSGRVVCEGTRRYRLCHECLMEAGCDNMVLDLPNTASQSAAQYFDEDKGWPVTDDDDLAEDSGTDLIIQEVEDSEDESEQKEVKPMMS